jgi:hypothetical protein
MHDLRGEIRSFGIKEKNRVRMAKNINTGFENAVKPTESCKAVLSKS